jgi:hypothetical protein
VPDSSTDQPLTRVGRGDVQGQRLDVRIELNTDLLGDGFELALVTVGEQHSGTEGRERARMRRPHAAGTPVTTATRPSSRVLMASPRRGAAR